ncbi:hypothetical protein ACE38W_01835 [Chitinophaga sp. Hz27]|uniref:hypothetical protein n=1 Tax=Chitinophaga sp. Hz27 TaxID=3347169 RepID=UPI0035D84734
MSEQQSINPPGASLPSLTHQRVQELKETTKGQRITQEPLATLPFLVKSLTKVFEGKLNLFEKALAAKTACPEGITSASLVEEYEFLEFVQYIMFVKFTEEKPANNQAVHYGQLRAS